MKKAVKSILLIGFLAITTIATLAQINNKKMGNRAYKLSPGAKITGTKTTATTTTKFSTTPNLMAIYMDKLDSSHLIIGNTQRENDFISFITLHGFNCVYTYDLNTTLSTSQGRLDCASFVERLHAINVKVIAVGASEKYLTSLTQVNSRAKYQSQMTTAGRLNAKFDGLNLELEAWRYPKPDTDTWDNWQKIFLSTRTYCKSTGITADAYIGNLEDKQGLKTPAKLADFIVANCDHLNLHCYVNSTKAAQKDALFNYILTRINELGLAAIRATEPGKPVKKFKVAIIFSASPGKLNDAGVLVEIHMQDWFKTHTITETYAGLINSANTIKWAGSPGIDLIGCVGYGYQDFLTAWQ